MAMMKPWDKEYVILNHDNPDDYLEQLWKIFNMIESHGEDGHERPSSDDVAEMVIKSRRNSEETFNFLYDKLSDPKGMAYTRNVGAGVLLANLVHLRVIGGNEERASTIASIVKRGFSIILAPNPDGIWRQVEKPSDKLKRSLESFLIFCTENYPDIITEILETVEINVPRYELYDYFQKDLAPFIIECIWKQETLANKARILLKR